MKKNPILIDGIAQNIATPATFKVPNATDKLNIRVGDLVKVGVANQHPNASAASERIWVNVTEVLGETFTGGVISFPVFPDGIDVDYRDTLSFEARHILDSVSVEQQEMKQAVEMVNSKPFEELVELSKGAGKHVWMNVDVFKQVDLATIPEGLLVNITGVNIAIIMLDRIGEQVDALVIGLFVPCECHEKFDGGGVGQAMVDAANVLIDEGHPLENPEVSQEYVGASWNMTFPVTKHPGLLLEEITHYCGRITRNAKRVLSSLL